MMEDNLIIQRLNDSLNYEFDLSFNERKSLLEYITKLQQENRNLKIINEQHRELNGKKNK